MKKVFIIKYLVLVTLLPLAYASGQNGGTNVIPGVTLSGSISELTNEIKNSNGIYLSQTVDYLYPNDHNVRILSQLTINLQSGELLYKNWRITNKERLKVGTTLDSSQYPQFVMYRDLTGVYASNGGANDLLSLQSGFNIVPYIDEMGGFLSLKSCPTTAGLSSILDQQIEAASKNGNARLLAYLIDEKNQLADVNGEKDRSLVSGPVTIKIHSFSNFIQSYSETVGGEVVRMVTNKIMQTVPESIRPSNILNSDHIVTIAQQFTTSFKPADKVLGLLLHQVNGKTIITGILPDSAASKAGLLEGEEVLKINGIDTFDKTDQDLVSLVKQDDNVEITYKDANSLIKRISITKIPLNH